MPLAYSLDPAHPTPPNSLEECVQRLSDARAKLEAVGYIAPFSDNELLAMAQNAAVEGLKERFIMRICDSRFATLAHTLGQANNAGTVAYWTSTFSCLESADTDPELIRNVLGLGFNPEASYSLLIIDTFWY